MSPDAYRLAPKVELHLHLEGAIPLDTLWSIVQRHGGDPAVPDRDALVAKLAYRDFAHFIEAWTWMTGFLRTPDDFTVASGELTPTLKVKRNVVLDRRRTTIDDIYGETPSKKKG